MRLYELDISLNKNFITWFGNSKVTDKLGNPLIVYHGTPDSRFIWQDGFKVHPWTKDEEKAFFFTASRSVAKTYADDSRAWDYQNAVAGIIDVYLRIENPKIIDWKGERFRGTDAVIAAAYSEGYDGVIIHNVIDDYHGLGKPSTVYVVFNPNQIKSIKNNGNYSNDDNRIIENELFENLAFTTRSKGVTLEHIKANVDKIQIALHKPKIYRAIYHNDDFLYVDPTQSTRISRNTSNYYTLVMDNTKAWDKFPKRSQSLICTESIFKASRIGKVYVVLPFHDPLIGICPQPDIWDSFDYLYQQTQFEKLKYFNSALSQLYTDITNGFLNDDNYETFISQLQEIDGKRFQDFDYDVLKHRYYNFCGGDVISIKKIFSYLNPIKNKFKLTSYSNYKPKEDREVWFSGPAFLIEKHLYDSLVVELKQGS